MPMPILKTLLAASGLALLSACSLNFMPGRPDPIPTPIAANPAALRIAVLAPEPFHMRDGQVKLTVYQRGGAGGDISRDYMLVAADTGQADAAVAKIRKPGQVLHVYRLAPADALNLRDQQEQMASARTGSAIRGLRTGPIYAGSSARRRAPPQGIALAARPCEDPED